MAGGTTEIYAQIGVAQHTPVGARRLAEQLKQRFPAYVEKLPIDHVTEPLQPGLPLRLMIGPCAIEVYAMPQPIPSEALSIALATDRDWPQARAALARSYGHLGVVPLRRKDGRDDPFLNAICVTLVCAALCEMTPAIGVLWPTGNRLSEAGRFRAVAGRMAAGEPAIDLWVQTLFTDGPALNGQRSLCAMTTGLRPFVGRELELLPVVRGQETVGKIVGSLLAAIARRGAGFEDGDSVDLGNGEAACLRLESQGQRADIPIFAARLAKLDAQGRPPAEAFGDRPPPRTESASADQPATAPKAAKLSRFIALIPLARPSAISAELLIAAVKRRFPSFNGQMVAPGSDDPQAASGNNHLIQIGSTAAAIMSLDVPLAPSELDRAIAAAEPVWPEARATVAPHTAHIVVANLTGATDCLGAARCAGQLSLLTAALCDLVPALAVYWGAGNVITRPQDFQEGAGRFVTGAPPVDIWVQLQPLKDTTADGQPSVGMATSGLAAFVGREIEFVPAKLDPAAVGQRVIGAATYLLMNGPVLEDGHTLGVSENEAIRVRHLDRGLRGGPVYELSLELLAASMAPPGMTTVQAVPAAPRPEERPTAPPAPRPRPTPGVDASRLVRNLRRPTS